MDDLRNDEMEISDETMTFRMKILFTCNKGDQEVVFFYDEKGAEISCELDQGAYKAVSDQFMSSLEHVKQKPFAVIDHDWAVQTFKKHFLDQKQETASGPGEKESVSEPNNGGNIHEEVMKPEKPPVKKALFCRRCGARLLSDSLFCSMCGTKVIY